MWFCPLRSFQQTCVQILYTPWDSGLHTSVCRRVPSELFTWARNNCIWVPSSSMAKSLGHVWTLIYGVTFSRRVYVKMRTISVGGVDDVPNHHMGCFLAFETLSSYIWVPILTTVFVSFAERNQEACFECCTQEGCRWRNSCSSQGVIQTKCRGQEEEACCQEEGRPQEEGCSQEEDRSQEEGEFVSSFGLYSLFSFPPNVLCKILRKLEQQSTAKKPAAKVRQNDHWMSQPESSNITNMNLSPLIIHRRPQPRRRPPLRRRLLPRRRPPPRRSPPRKARNKRSLLVLLIKSSLHERAFVGFCVMWRRNWSIPVLSHVQYRVWLAYL